MRALLLVAVLALAGCDWEPPLVVNECIRWETRTEMVYWPQSGGMGVSLTPYGAGVHLGGGLHAVTRTECADWSEPHSNPAHEAWLRRNAPHAD